jgi:hypothetical protein
MVQFTPAIYAAALQRAATELLNVHLSHTVPVIKELLHTDTQYYAGFSLENNLVPIDYSVIYDGYGRNIRSVPTDYSIIYLDMNTSIKLNDADTYALAVKIRSSLELTNNIMILSNYRELKNILTQTLKVNYVSNTIQGSDEAVISAPPISWTLQDDIVNLILITSAKKLYVFSEQSIPVERAYETPVIINRVSTQHFTFFYSKVDISPMPVFQYR